ncbi:MAG: hypothetical protein RLZZ182_631 [Pseudomonadota bacterium]|jgi:glycosyltransferase involved in cell wall biosynthesis
MQPTHEPQPIGKPHDPAAPTAQRPAPKRAICAFYASTHYGSEYRAGIEFIRYAAHNGFDLAVIADLEENSSAEELQALFPGMRVVRIPSIVTRQQTLYRFTDLLPQTVWHWRASHWLKQHAPALEAVWIQNGALPWLPLSPYFALTKHIVWGPVGGGESPTPRMLAQLPMKVRLREQMRGWLETSMLRGKRHAIRRKGAPRVTALARTNESRRQLEQVLGLQLPVVPEILEPLKAVDFQATPTTAPRFVWVGQNIARKNLPLALRCFVWFRDNGFPDARLEIYGCEASAGPATPGVTYHGWVRRIDWAAIGPGAVLLLTSFREGLPSVVLEALQNGLLCVSSDVGAISSLGSPGVVTLPLDEYPEFSEASLKSAADRIAAHLASARIRRPSISYQAVLNQHLRLEGIVS